MRDLYSLKIASEKVELIEEVLIKIDEIVQLIGPFMNDETKTNMAIEIVSSSQTLQDIHASLPGLGSLAGSVEVFDAIHSHMSLYESIYGSITELNELHQNLQRILEAHTKAQQTHEDAQSASVHAGHAFLSATASKEHEEGALQALKDALYQVSLATQQAINAKGWYVEAKAQAEKARLSEQGAMSSYAESEILEKIVRDNLAKTQTFAQVAQDASEFSAEVLETSTTYKDLALSAKDTIMNYFLNISSMLESVQQFHNVAASNANLSTQKAQTATEKANIATEKATVATQKADIATTQAELATQKASAAASSATDASLFASQAAITAGIYASTDDGLTHTTTGQFFSVKGESSSVYVSLYQNVAGVAVLVNTIYSSQKTDEEIARLEKLMGHMDFAVRTSVQGEMEKKVGSLDYLNKTVLVYELHRAGLNY